MHCIIFQDIRVLQCRYESFTAAQNRHFFIIAEGSKDCVQVYSELFTSAVKETADIIFPAGYFYHSLHTRTVFGVLPRLNLVLFNGVINN